MMPDKRGARRPALVTFALAKYARPLLVDAGLVSSFRGFDQGGRPHVLDFVDILLVTAGAGRFRLDGETHVVRSGVVLFTRPGQVRQWSVSHLEGACVFFREDFVAEAFSDPQFLDQFAPFRPSRPTGALALAPRQRRQFLDGFASMRREIGDLRADAGHALRATLYELLVMLDRHYVRRNGGRREAHNQIVTRFREGLDRDFRHLHRVGDYAARLGVTPGHLNALCRATLGRTAGACVRARLLLEAKRLLLYTDLTSSAIAHALGFDDPSYFVRFFRREAGSAPIGFRRAQRA
jgi:AraC family transcriptional regulator, transcriptional activator of pobA